MEYRKIPLEKQLGQIAKNCYAHPEYAPSAIRAWGEMPIGAYLGTEDRRKCFRQLLGITEDGEQAMAYGEAVKRIAPWFDDDRFTVMANQALRLLSEPLYEAYRKWEEQQNEKEKNAT